jgi:ActR/RegA family two-component response regulator
VHASRTILIVDSNARAGEQLESSFRRSGLETIMVSSPSSAVSRWLSAAMGLAVVDDSYPPFGGVNLALELKRAAPQRPVVAVSSAPSVAMAVRAIRLGLDGFLARPTSAVAILAALEEQSGLGAVPRAPLTLDEAIWEHISQTLVSSGSLAEAARRLGVERRSLRRMVEKYSPKG